MQARRASAAAAVAAAAALLVIARAASAYVVPEVVLMRIKRSPEPMRSFSFSGYDPSHGQMAAFTGMAEYPMFGNGNSYGPAQASSPYYGQQTQDSYGPPLSPPQTQDSYGPPPSGVEQPAADPGKPQTQYGASAEYGSKPGGASDPREQSGNSVEQTDNKKQHKGRDGPSSNAEASFNAWFPIMFGVFPSGNGNGGVGQSSNPAGRGQEQAGSSGGNGFERLSGGGTTVIANSVSNGRHGVATSHAIAYGNPRSSQK